MIILSIETSCDETAVAVVEMNGSFPDATYTILGNGLITQIEMHREFGGVVPNIAKREHAKALVPMLIQALQEAGMLKKRESTLNIEALSFMNELFVREPGLADTLTAFFASYEFPKIDTIAVTSGPGLEPALWVGINFARALGQVLDKNVIPTNHMEGHILASLFKDSRLAPVSFPALALLISGGHTELVLMKDWGVYEKIGQTRDDAVGEAFDKVARMMGLPYPGGPEISKIAVTAREQNLPMYGTQLPRPMLQSGDHDFSFSGLKTSVRTRVLDKELTIDEKSRIARDFEDCVAEVLMKKTFNAAEIFGVHTIILGGGVTANNTIRANFTEKAAGYQAMNLYLPDRELSTDNAIMIALAGTAHLAQKATQDAEIKADGNLALA